MLKRAGENKSILKSFIKSDAQLPVDLLFNEQTCLCLLF
jgi:hypothetical protein